MIILMGLAGSGKSTQGRILAERLGAEWLSAGQVLRDVNDPEIKAVQDRGELVDDAITIRLMAEAIRRAQVAGRDVILDGYPRTEQQAKWIAENLRGSVKAVIWLEVPKTELIQRIKLRGRSDDLDDEAIEERLKIVEQNCYTVCHILAEGGVKILAVDGVGTPDEVTARVWETVEKLQNLDEGEEQR